MNSSLEIYLIKPVDMSQDDVISLTFGKSLVNKMRKNDSQKTRIVWVVCLLQKCIKWNRIAI